MSTHVDDPVLPPSDRAPDEVQSAVELVAWRNRKLFARRRRLPWIARLAYASAIDAYLLGLEHATRGLRHRGAIELHLHDLKKSLLDDEHAEGRKKRATATPSESRKAA